MKKNTKNNKKTRIRMIIPTREATTLTMAKSITLTIAATKTVIRITTQ